ncbi:hypothetical protein BJY00DRAFT_61213 [Aspergillus carlsbadensis]|nr:hypothetical protein BJY00DRAFT_61213 [Aspergillus carlsbadensis]
MAGGALIVNAWEPGQPCEPRLPEGHDRLRHMSELEERREISSGAVNPQAAIANERGVWPDLSLGAALRSRLLFLLCPRGSSSRPVILLDPCQPSCQSPTPHTGFPATPRDLQSYRSLYCNINDDIHVPEVLKGEREGRTRFGEKVGEHLRPQFPIRASITGESAIALRQKSALLAARRDRNALKRLSGRKATALKESRKVWLSLRSCCSSGFRCLGSLCRRPVSLLLAQSASRKLSIAE